LKVELRAAGSATPIGGAFDVVPGNNRSVDLPRLPSAGNYTIHVRARDGTTQPLAVSLTESQVQVQIVSTWPFVGFPGQPFDVTATVAALPPAVATPTGTIAIHDATGPLCVVALPGSRCTVTSATASGNNLVAYYSGDENYDNANSPTYNNKHYVGGRNTRTYITDVDLEPSTPSGGTWVHVTVYSSDSVPPYGGSIRVTDGTAQCGAIAGNGWFGNWASGACMLHSTPGVQKLVASYSGSTGNGWHAGSESAPLLHAVSTEYPNSPLPPGTEICGFDPDVAYPRADEFVPLATLSGSVPSFGIARSVTGTAPPQLDITVPAAGASLHGDTVDVAGTFTGPLNTGIVVNGVRARTVDGKFLAANVPIEAGANELTAIATTLTGATATTAVAVTVGGPAPPISIRIVDSMGETSLGPTRHQLSFDTTNLPAGTEIASMTFGMNDNFDAAYTGVPITETQAVFPAGLHTVHLSVTTTGGETHIAQQPVLVEDMITQRGMLCDVYAYFRSRVSANDLQGALLAYQPDVRERFESTLAPLGAALSSMAPRLGVIVTGGIDAHDADLLLVRDEAGQERSGFPLRMTRGADGVWRIQEM
jgi:hypothetical protein